MATAEIVQKNSTATKQKRHPKVAFLWEATSSILKQRLSLSHLYGCG